ncbi:hypothetical protein BRADI_4g43044v3 [Brachypodium distachyon]|uniref:Uncharacterized protein n=1 Tax=Brachypodium distachyon TaxID=15368 RepID=A0A2K2CTX0_BRADI|nr:hypothetical protein BRADI_4g43044v3 [Brachypodium distachyon]
MGLLTLRDGPTALYGFFLSGCERPKARIILWNLLAFPLTSSPRRSTPLRHRDDRSEPATTPSSDSSQEAVEHFHRQPCTTSLVPSSLSAVVDTQNRATLLATGFILLRNGDYEIEQSRLVCLKEELERQRILQPTKLSLLRAEDLLRKSSFGRGSLLELGTLAHCLLRQWPGIARSNMMRGINVSSLLRLDNMLWSQKHHTVILKETNLSDQEDIISPYHTIHDQFEKGVKISMGCEPSDLRYPACLQEYLGLLSADEWVDKRLITNHSVIKSPSERLHRNLRVNHLLRRQFVYHGRRRTEGTAARAVLEKLGVRGMTPGRVTSTQL